MHLAKASEGNLIRSCSADGIGIGDNVHTESLIVTESVVTAWPVVSIDTATDDDFAELLKLEPELILVGTGSEQKFPDPAKYAALLRQGIGIEFMSSAAACRTYNIVVMEGRRVLAALIKPQG